jgi:hypothetical protein
MKDKILDGIEKHVVYFLTGFVAVVSALLVVVFLYLFMFAPIIFLGGYYFLALPVMSALIYYLGKRIMKGLE